MIRRNRPCAAPAGGRSTRRCSFAPSCRPIVPSARKRKPGNSSRQGGAVVRDSRFPGRLQRDGLKQQGFHGGLATFRPSCRCQKKTVLSPHEIEEIVVRSFNPLPAIEVRGGLAGKERIHGLQVAVSQEQRGVTGRTTDYRHRSRDLLCLHP